MSSATQILMHKKRPYSAQMALKSNKNIFVIKEDDRQEIFLGKKLNSKESSETKARPSSVQVMRMSHTMRDTQQLFANPSKLIQSQKVTKNSIIDFIRGSQQKARQKGGIISSRFSLNKNNISKQLNIFNDDRIQIEQKIKQVEQQQSFFTNKDLQLLNGKGNKLDQFIQIQANIFPESLVNDLRNQNQQTIQQKKNVQIDEFQNAKSMQRLKSRQQSRPDAIEEFETNAYSSQNFTEKYPQVNQYTNAFQINLNIDDKKIFMVQNSFQKNHKSSERPKIIHSEHKNENYFETYQNQIQNFLNPYENNIQMKEMDQNSLDEIQQDEEEKIYIQQNSNQNQSKHDINSLKSDVLAETDKFDNDKEEQQKNQASPQKKLDIDLDKFIKGKKRSFDSEKLRKNLRAQSVILNKQTPKQYGILAELDVKNSNITFTSPLKARQSGYILKTQFQQQSNTLTKFKKDHEQYSISSFPIEDNSIKPKMLGSKISNYKNIQLKQVSQNLKQLTSLLMKFNSKQQQEYLKFLDPVQLKTLFQDKKFLIDANKKSKK